MKKLLYWVKVAAVATVITAVAAVVIAIDVIFGWPPLDRTDAILILLGVGVELLTAAFWYKSRFDPSWIIANATGPSWGPGCVVTFLCLAGVGFIATPFLGPILSFVFSTAR